MTTSRISYRLPLLLACTVALVAGCSNGKAKDKGQDRMEANTSVPVEVQPLQRAPIVAVYSGTAPIEAHEEEAFRQSMSKAPKRVRYLLSGVVQGVGFRPFLYRAATKHRLGGYVCNTPEGVIAEVEGPGGRIDQFAAELLKGFPPASEVACVSSTEVAVLGESDFRIAASEQEGNREVLISPDIATCADCRLELQDPKDRRYRYPFINCTH